MSDISYNAYTVAAEFLDDVYKDESFFVFFVERDEVLGSVKKVCPFRAFSSVPLSLVWNVTGRLGNRTPGMATLKMQLPLLLCVALIVDVAAYSLTPTRAVVSAPVARRQAAVFMQVRGLPHRAAD